MSLSITIVRTAKFAFATSVDKHVMQITPRWISGKPPKNKKKVAVLVQEIKVEITEQATQMEKTTEMLKKNGEKIAAARGKVLTTVGELIRVLKEHEKAMVTKLDNIKNEQQRD